MELEDIDEYTPESINEGINDSIRRSLQKNKKLNYCKCGKPLIVGLICKRCYSRNKRIAQLEINKHGEIIRGVKNGKNKNKN